MKKMSRRLLACALAVAMLVSCAISGLVLPAAAEEPTNLFTNGDFENGTPGSGWTETGVSVVDGVGHNGSKGLKIAKGTSSVWCGTPTIAFKNGTTYLLRYVTKGGVTSFTMPLGAGKIASADISSKTQKASDDWVQQVVIFTANNDITKSTSLTIYGNADTDVYYDNFELYEYEVGMNLMPGSDGSSLAGADGAYYYVFNGHMTTGGITMKVATDPADTTNKVWELSATSDTVVRSANVDFLGLDGSGVFPEGNVAKVSYRFKGKTDAKPNVLLQANSGGKLVKNFVTGPDANGWYTATAWLMRTGDLRYMVGATFTNTAGMYVDDFSFCLTNQTATNTADTSTIPAISEMQFAQPEVPMVSGSTALIYPQGKVGEVWDANAYCGNVTFSSSDSTVATVDATSGLVKMISNTPGATATITATSSVTNVPVASYTVKMTVIEPTAIQMNKTQVTLLGAGATDTLSVVGTAPANSTALPEKTTWTSSDESVATVNANGVVTAVYTGDKLKTATITATYQGVKTPATATVTVNNNLLPDDVLAGITANTDAMTKYESGGYQDKPYITLPAAEGADVSYTFTVTLQRPLKTGKKYLLSAILKGKNCEVQTTSTNTYTWITWTNTAATADSSWVEAYGKYGYFEASSNTSSFTITFVNKAGSDIAASLSSVKVFELTEEVNLLSGSAGDLVGNTQENFSKTTQTDGDGNEWYYIAGNTNKKHDHERYGKTGYIYEYSVKYKPADATNGKFYANLESSPNKNGDVISTQVVGPDADGWYTYTAWIEQFGETVGFLTSVPFCTTGPVYAKDWSCYLVPKTQEPIYGSNKVLACGSQTTLASLTWLGAANANAQWSIGDENILSFADGSKTITAASVTVKAKAFGTTTVTVKAGEADPVTILVKVLPNTFEANFDISNANVVLKDLSGNFMNSLIPGALISVEVTPNSGYLPTPGTLRYVDAEGTEKRLLNRTSMNGTVNSYMMKVPEGAFTLKNDLVSTSENSFTAGTIATSYRELDSEQGGKVDGIRFLTRLYIEGLDLTGDTIKIKYNGTEYEVESMGTLLKRATNTTELTLENVGSSDAGTIWMAENYSKADGNSLSVSGYSDNSLDFAAIMTTSNPSETFKDRKYTSRGYIQLEGLDEIIYTTPRTDSAADAQKRATGELVTSSAKYGVKWSTTDPDDLGARCFDAEGLTATIGIGDTNGYSDFDNIYPWSGMVRCNIKEGADGEDVIVYEGEDGFALDGSNGNVFVRIPKFSVQKYTEDGYEYRVITGDNTNLHPAFIEDGKVLDAIYVGAFEGYIDEGKLSSVSGVIPSNNVYAADFLTAAQANGVRYTMYDNRSVDALWTLVAVEYGCRNTNRVFGYGVADYKQPDSNYGSCIVRFDGTDTNEVYVTKNVDATERVMPVGSTITICRDTQDNIIAQRKITGRRNETVEGVEYTVFEFDGESLDLIKGTFDKDGKFVSGDFVGSAPIYTNYVEDAPSGAMTTWHTGRANWITTDENLKVTQNPIRYRWIENPVGNVWHFLPDVTFKNGEMYTCNNIRDYEFGNADGIKYISTGITSFENNYPNNGYKNDTTGLWNEANGYLPNLWITSLIDDSGHVFGDEYSKELTSKQAFGAYYYMRSRSTYDKDIPVFIANGGGFDHQWRCNMLTNRGWMDASNKWYLYGSRLLYKQIQE